MIAAFTIAALAMLTPQDTARVIVNQPARYDVSHRLAPIAGKRAAPGVYSEQTTHGSRPAARIVASFDGMGFGFKGPQDPGQMRNPSDNSLAVGPNHIVEIVNSRMSIYTKKGAMFDTTGRVLYGAAPTNVLFAGFGGICEPRPNGDAVVRYDQLAKRWLYVMPIFRRGTPAPGRQQGDYAMCYAVSVGEDPLGPFHRYEFTRPLFPDYPRPAIWPDGYYIPTSTGDDVIEKHACVADRTKMLQGLAATEQCVIIPDVNFLNNADIDGYGLPPAGAPNIMVATGGTQLRKDFDDDGLYVWKFHVDWDDPANTKVTGPQKLSVAPYHYLCDGQLTSCVTQPGTDRRLDAQGDKIMNRVVYRNIEGRESILALHSVNTTAGAGGVRWYELRLDDKRDPYVHQQSTYAPDGFYRWMGSMGMDRQGNIGIGYSFGGAPNYPGQRFAARTADAPSGALDLREAVLVEGQASQTNTLRWEDYTTLAMDPVDDCTFWYVGDYLKRGAQNYTTRIGGFRLPDCMRASVRGSAFFDADHDGFRDPGEPGIPQVGIRIGERETVRTDSAGEFATWIPADPMNVNNTVRITEQSPPLRPMTMSKLHTNRSNVAAALRTYTVRPADQDEISSLDFGRVCTVVQRGGATPAFWAGSEGEAMMQNNAMWRRPLVTTYFLANDDGTRFTADSTSAGAGRVRASLSAGNLPATPGGNPQSGGNLARTVSQQLAALALSAAYNRTDAAALVEDPVTREWVPISALAQRISAFVASNPRVAAGSAAARQMNLYAAVLRILNGNTAVVTPASPAGWR